VIFQVTRIILQCMSRRVAGDPLTAFEAHTPVHATCALIMYTLGFRKPLDIQESALVAAVGLEKDIALMLLRTPGLTLMPYRNVVFSSEYKRAQIRDPYYRHWPGKAASEATFLAFCAPSDSEDSYDLLYKNLGPVKGKDFGEIVRFVVNEETGKKNAIIYPIQTTRPPLFSPGPPLGTSIVGTLETGEFMGNGIGPNTFAAGFLKSQYRMCCENCLNFHPSCKPTLPSGLPELPGSLWYGKFLSDVSTIQDDMTVSFLSLCFKKILGDMIWQPAAFMDGEQGTYNRDFTNMRKVYGSNHFLVPRSKNFNLTGFRRIWSSLCPVCRFFLACFMADSI